MKNGKLYKVNLIERFQVIVDTREQTPWRFTNEVIETVPAGDYTVGLLFENIVIKMDKVFAIERKSAVGELYAASGLERDRFIAELEKLDKLQFKFVICEFSFSDIQDNPPPGKVSADVVYGSILSWTIKYNIPFLFFGNRKFARMGAWKLMSFFIKQTVLGER